MKINKKIFLSILSFSLLIALITSVCDFIELFAMKNRLIDQQTLKGEALRNSSMYTIERSNLENVRIISRSYSQAIDQCFQATLENIEVMKLHLENNYKLKSATTSSLLDSTVSFISGVDAAGLQTELGYIRSVRDLIGYLVKGTNYHDAYFVSQSGMMLANNTYDLSLVNQDMRTRDWYVEAAKKKGASWTDVYEDLITGSMMITGSMPVYKPDGTLAGVAAIDIKTYDIVKDILNNQSELLTYSFLLDKTGKFILGSKLSTDLSSILKEDQIKKVVSEIISSPFTEGSYLEPGVLLGFSDIPSTGWKVGVLLNYEEIIEPAKKVGEDIQETTNEIEKAIGDSITNTLISAILSIAVILLIIVFISKKVSETITKPIEKLDAGAHILSQGNLDYKIEINTKDELGELAQTFNYMTTKLKDQMNNLEAVTADKERIKTELNVATTIQESMLPCVFPAFPERPEFDIYATMHPAKEVGGDFYDFFMIDDNTLAFVIADVSGKGVPAALFMVIAKILIQNHAQSGLSPSEVFRIVNNRLCDNNGAGMFLTAFLGILNLSTGKLVFSNAGHNLPLIYKEGQGFNWLKTKPKFVLAGFPDMKYTDEEVTICVGDKIYLYTDGVTEALNPEAQLYSDNHLFDELNKEGVGKTSPKGILEFMARSVKDFVNGAEQSDDITMMAIELKKANSHEQEAELN